MIDLESARGLLDFSKRIGPGQRAEEQLKGAVALHNVLERQGVAYLADEVGMGKTYVALGALALFRHENPQFRVLVIAPRANIQAKWMKELKNFVANNYRHADLRMKGLDGRPVRRLVSCESLVDLVSETALDPDRDFFMRMTSFSLSVGGKDRPTIEDVRPLRDRLRQHMPWLDDDVFDLRSKQQFKENFANAVCCALPEFDLVIVDEAHNLKHGYSRTGSARNHVLAHALGRSEAEVDLRKFPGYGPRAKQVLMLSATPVEETYRHLWNQLDMFGRAAPFELLKDNDGNESQQKELAAQFLIRRVTAIQNCGQELTKNLYRREWRGGGVELHDEPISGRNPLERLTVALVQKKVSELLGHERFGSSFQIGMLASFESFLETAKVKRDEEAVVFDDIEQAQDEAERDGIDVRDINRLARAYRKQFGTELPHPKMDALVAALASSWESGAKSLVFVRRVASVKELKRKLDERYDEWLLGRLRAELPSPVLPRLDDVVKQYRRERQEALEQDLGRPETSQPEERELEADRGGHDTFFAWFFRGEQVKGVISGGNIQRRFIQTGTTYSTFFEDNYVAYILGCAPAQAEEQLRLAVRLQGEALYKAVQERSRKYLSAAAKQARGDVFEAVQAGAVELLAETGGPHSALAKEVLRQRFRTAARKASKPPQVSEWLSHCTFFTELRERSALRQVLWPASREQKLTDAFKEQELRRHLLSVAARLGHGLVDLYVLTIKRLGSIELRARASTELEVELEPIHEYLDVLGRQMAVPKAERGWTGFDELADLARNFDLIVDVNLPDARETDVADLGPLFGRLLREQQPIAGMAGEINQTVVRQFRMPGYPLVLVSTDLLQEGEDLHTFCSSIYHYGISWTPSSMEQRTGRIDRVRSETDRRIAAAQKRIEASEKLQVYFPHLSDTVEVLQVRRVLDRMDVFLRLMHEGLTVSKSEESRINVERELNREYRPWPQSQEPLKTSFPILKKHLQGTGRDIAATVHQIDGLVDRFNKLKEFQVPDIPIEWHESLPGSHFGVAKLKTRQQPFQLVLDLYEGFPRLRCISPVGRITPQDRQTSVIASAWKLRARIGAVLTKEDGSYDLTVEQDVLLADAAHDASRMESLLRRVVDEADDLEKEYLPGLDQAMSVFRRDLEGDDANGR